MSDSLNLLAKTCGRIEGGGALKNRYLEWVNPDAKKAEEPEMTEDDILDKFIRDLGVEGG